MNTRIAFNKPFLTGKETDYIKEAVASGKISGDGMFTKKCHQFFEEKYGFKKVLLTHSCTAALEMAAILLNIGEGDEIIMPSFTFVSTANAFVLRGAKVVFADCDENFPNITPQQIENLISPKTKAVLVIHYGGVACEMDEIMEICKNNNLFLVEDAAHCIDSYYKGRPLGSLGHLSAFSFHETKNVISGEGGMLVLNDDSLIERAEIIREKGTNRAAFFRGEVDKYTWVDIGSSFLPSELIAAFLYAQLEHLPEIQTKRIKIWNFYNKKLRSLKDKGIQFAKIPDFATQNGHLFYMVCNTLEERTELISFLKKRSIYAVFHYQPLHLSPFFNKSYKGKKLPYTIKFADHLLRLPLYYDLTENDLERVVNSIIEFYD